MYSERFQAFHRSLIYIGKCGFTKRMIVKKGYEKIKSLSEIIGQHYFGPLVLVL